MLPDDTRTPSVPATSSDRRALTNESLPSLYRALDRVSLAGQARYLRLIRADLIALVLGALLSSVSLDGEMARRAAYGGSAVLLILGLVFTIILMHKGYEQQWYGGRAAAESVKTIAWRYSVRAEPFHDAPDEQTADRQFASALAGILAQSTQLRLPLGGEFASHQQVTDAMRELRRASLHARQATYLHDRIDDQRRWYGGKAEYNTKAEDRLFRVVVAIQTLTVLYAITLVAVPARSVNLTGALTTLAAVLLVWLQAKQHQELAQSYAVAAHELGLVAEQATHVRSDAEFAVFVADAENAISREHTLWTARRDRIPRLARF